MTYESAVKKLRYIFTEFPELELVERVHLNVDEPNGLALEILTRSPAE